MQGAQHLGEFDQSLLVFGGCYSNLHATKALKAWADERGFTPDRVICTGDIVAYCAHPKETSELVRDWGVHCIQGNVEQSLAESADDCGCGFEEGSTCDILSNGWYNFSQKKVDSDLRQWFSSMPEYLTFDILGKRALVVHGAPSNVSRFMYHSQPNADYESEFAMSGKDVDIVIAGHSGLPFTKQVGDRYWHNSGALGMPANDGMRNVWFSTLDAVEGQIMDVLPLFEREQVGEEIRLTNTEL